MDNTEDLSKLPYEERAKRRDELHQAARDKDLLLQEKGKQERLRTMRSAIENFRRQDWGRKS